MLGGQEVGRPGWGWVSVEEAILDGDTFSFPERCGGQHQQQEPRQQARLALWNENIPLLLLLSGVAAVWALLSAWPNAVACAVPAGQAWVQPWAGQRAGAPQGVCVCLPAGWDAAGKCSLGPFWEALALSGLEPPLPKATARGCTWGQVLWALLPDTPVSPVAQPDSSNLCSEGRLDPVGPPRKGFATRKGQQPALLVTMWNEARTQGKGDIWAFGVLSLPSES